MLRKQRACCSEVRIRHTRLFEATVLNSVLATRKSVERSVYVKGATVWNALPATTRNIATYEAFKKFNKNWLKNKVEAM